MSASDFANGDESPSPDAGSGAPFGDGGRPPGDLSARGVILVHAASFPSFRLCFSGLLDQLPQPDSRIMPEANVVGVEIGSLVRLDPMTAPGTVYVIPEKDVRTDPGDPPKSCRTLIGDGNAGTKKGELDLDLDYHVAGRIDEPLGHHDVTVLAITGCGAKGFLNIVGAASATCGADWDPGSGNLVARAFDVPLSDRASQNALPVQLFQMSHELAAGVGEAGTLSVTFGKLGPDAGAPGQSVPSGALYEGGEPTTLTLDQTNASVYASTGFRITAGSNAAVEQSLASVQELSSSQDLPTQYYRVASSYALLLVGDPSHTPTTPGGDPNPSYNPRRAIHLLAVPIVDPTPRDAGVVDPGTNDAGDDDAG